MPTLYILQQNSVLRKRGNRLLLCKHSSASSRSSVLQGDILLDVPCADVDHVMIFGNVQLTTQALQHMLKRGIECALFTKTGRLLGQLTPPLGRNIELRARQFELFSNSNFSLEFSRKIVAAKIDNALNLLRRFRKNNPEKITLADLKILSPYLLKVRDCRSLGQLRGLEGAAAAAYFRLFSNLLPDEWTFTTRSRRPPKDPVNAVLSFGYVVAASRIQALLDGIGFDPFFGVFHRNSYGRASLALDILEEFRQPLIDRLAIRLFNQRILNQNDFQPHAGEAVYLVDSGKAKFFREYERSMGQLTEAGDVNPGDILPAMQKQIRLLVKQVMDGIAYQPYIFRP